MAHPNVYPTGVTVYRPDKCFNGYTVFQALETGAVLLDMNGVEVNFWKGLHGFPNKIFPGGYILGHTGDRNTQYGMQDMLDLVQVDWEGNVVWRFDQYEYVEDPGSEGCWMARTHHDFQRQGNPVGYYVPGMEPQVDGGHTFLLCHKNVRNTKISDKLLHDDTIIEVDWEGNLVWEWCANEHFEEMGFDEAAKNILCRDPNMRLQGYGDWLHINSMSLLGPNRFYDEGDERFHPDNIIWDSREANIMAIIDKRTGKLVWRLGPDFGKEPQLQKLGWIIGQHHCHMIPRGLPGEGNILLYDNGGWAGYGLPNPEAPTGAKNARRDYSRVLELDPVSLEVAWQYSPAEAGYEFPNDFNRFYSPITSSAQRLPNGNTLITEGTGGRIFEVTAAHELVWEYISPYWGQFSPSNLLYRAYRVPYEWIPQLEKPQETEIKKLDVRTFRVPGAAAAGDRRKETIVSGVRPYQLDSALCVASDRDLLNHPED